MKKLIFVFIIGLISSTTFSQQTMVKLKIILTDTDSIAEANTKTKIYTKDKSFNFEGTTDDLGFLKLKVPLGKELFLDFYKFDTIFDFSQTIPMGNYGEYEIPFHLQIALIKNVVKNYNLPVFFESGKYDVTENSKKAIDDLFQMLNTKSDLKIEIGAHTDNIGSDSYNQTLSQNRASSIRNYLVAKGINGDRIIAKGYGETKPIGDNNDETGRAMNRRVEISILESN